MAAAVQRNTLLESLAGFSAAHPLDEKILLVPSFPVGQQILDALARSGSFHLNLRPATVFSLAHSIAGTSLAAEGRRLLSRAQLLAVVESACDEVLGPESYFGALRRSVGLHRALHRTLDELRRARVTPGDLSSAAFDDRRKGAELAALAKAYEAILARLGAADAAEVVRRAAAACAAGIRIPDGAHLLRPAALELAPLEEAFLEGWSDATVPLAEDVFDPARPSPGVFFAHALGEENEVRSVFRRILDEACTSTVEIVFDDDARTAPFSTSSRLSTASLHARRRRARLVHASGQDPRRPRLSRGFRRRPGRCSPTGARTWAPTYAERTAWAACARPASSGAPVYAGAGRYARLDALVERRGRRPSTKRRRPGGRPAKNGSRRPRRSLVRAVSSPRSRRSRGNRSLPALARSCAEIVRTLLARASDLDGAAGVALGDLFGQLAGLPERRRPAAEAASRLKEAVDALAVGSAGPAPGHVHAARLGRAGWSGRPWTFVLGLDEARFPGPPHQDPVLLDAEREALSGSRPGARLALPRRARSATRVGELHALLARLRGTAVLTFSNRDILQDAERFPSPVLLALFRAQEASRRRREGLRPRARRPSPSSRTERPRRDSGGSRGCRKRQCRGLDAQWAPIRGSATRHAERRARRRVHGLGRSPFGRSGRARPAPEPRSALGVAPREAREVPRACFRIRPRPRAARRAARGTSG